MFICFCFLFVFFVCGNRLHVREEKQRSCEGGDTSRDTTAKNKIKKTAKNKGFFEA